MGRTSQCFSDVSEESGAKVRRRGALVREDEISKCFNSQVNLRKLRSIAHDMDVTIVTSVVFFFLRSSQ